MDDLNIYLKAIVDEVAKQAQQRQTLETALCLKDLIASRTIARLTNHLNVEAELQQSLDEVRKYLIKQGMIDGDDTKAFSGVVKNNLLESINFTKDWDIQ